MLGARLNYVAVLVPTGLHFLLLIRQNVCEICEFCRRVATVVIILFHLRRFLSRLVAPGHLHSSLSAGPGTPPRKKVSTGTH